MSLLNWFRKSEQRGGIESPGVPMTGITLMAAANQNNNTPLGIITSGVALTSSTVWACVRVRAETIASLPLNLYRRRSDGSKERATDHPLWALLHDKPNAIMNSYTWRERLIYSKLLQGNSYDYVRRNGAGMPIELIPLDAAKVGVGVKDGQKLYKYDGQYLGIDDVLHVLNMTLDGVKGQSTIEYARTSVALDIALGQHGVRFFSQGTSGKEWIEIPGTLDDEQKQRFRQSWNANYTGVGNAWVPPLMTNGAKIHAMAIANDDAQFLESRQFSVSEVARWFRVPGHKVGDLSKASYASLEQQNTEFVSDTIRPDCVLIEQELNNRLLMPSEQGSYFFEFDLKGMLRGDQKSRYESYAIGRQWGWLSADDVREEENMNHLDGGKGKIYMVPVNMQPAERMLEAPSPMGVMKIGKPAAPADDADDQDAEDENRAVQAATAAAAITLADAMARMERKASEAITRAANKPGALPQILSEFYSRHEQLVAQAVYPSLRALALSIDSSCRQSAAQLAEAVLRQDRAKAWAEQFAQSHCRASLAKLSKAKPEEFQPLLDSWRNNVASDAQTCAQAFAAAALKK